MLSLLRGCTKNQHSFQHKSHVWRGTKRLRAHLSPSLLAQLDPNILFNCPLSFSRLLYFIILFPLLSLGCRMWWLTTPLPFSSCFYNSSPFNVFFLIPATILVCLLPLRSPSSHPLVLWNHIIIFLHALGSNFVHFMIVSWTSKSGGPTPTLFSSLALSWSCLLLPGAILRRCCPHRRDVDPLPL